MKFKSIALLLLALLSLTGCDKELTSEQKQYIDSVEKFRSEKDSYMENDPYSPFNQDSNVVFSNLKYYDIDTNFVFRSRLYEYAQKDTITIFGTKGEERKVVKFGYVKINYIGKDLTVNVYRGESRRGDEYYSIWFTDKTTGEDTYGVGRYIDFEYKPDSTHIYTIDFNLAYNPYCAYSARYSCAIPTKEDFIDLSIEAGELNFH